MGDKTIQRTFDAPAERTFEAARNAVANLGYTVLHSDASRLVISFNTGRSMWSWAGQDLTATVSREGQGSRVVVGGRTAASEFLPSVEKDMLTSKQIFSWGEKGRVSNKFLDEIATLLPSTPDPSPPRDGLEQQ